VDTAASDAVRITPDPLEEALTQFRCRFPRAKKPALEAIANIIQLDSSTSAETARNLRRVVERVLASDYGDRLDDAILLLSNMELGVVSELLRQSDLESEKSEDYSHVLIRALGRLKQLDEVVALKGSHNLGIRVAVAEALDEISSVEARGRLEEMRTDDSEFVRTVVEELLAD
jgi:HEAT repeat protein